MTGRITIKASRPIRTYGVFGYICLTLASPVVSMRGSFHGSDQNIKPWPGTVA